MADETVARPNSSIRPPKPLILAGESQDKASAWKAWRQQFSWYSIATQLEKSEKEIQCATLMSCIGPDACRVYNTFNLSADEEREIKVILKKFDEHFAPTPHESYVRYRFNKLMQQEGETFDEFLTKVRVLVPECHFAQLEDSLIRDKILFGIREESVRFKLLEDTDLTLEKAIQICQASEIATKQMKDMKINDYAVDEINRKKKNFRSSGKNEKVNQKKNSSNCGRCGRTHEKAKCPAFKATCYSCNKTGHFSQMCRSKRRSRVDEAVANPNENSDEDLFIGTVNSSREDDVWVETVLLNNKMPVKMKLDTGAQCNVLPSRLVTASVNKIIPSSTKCLVSFSKHKMKVKGEITMNCKIKEKCGMIKFLIVDEDVTPILGRKDCSNFGLVKRVEFLSSDSYKEKIFEGLGCVKNFEYDIELTENPEFKIYAPRKIPHAIQDEVKQELDRMVRMGVIKPVTEPTPAVSPLVIIRQNGKMRTCVDLTDLNKNVKRRHYPLKTLEEIAAKVKGSKFFAKLDCHKGFWQAKVSERTSKYLTMNTPWGRYSFLRVPFGLVSAPEVFQQMMNKVLDGIDNVECSMDDVLIYEDSREELKKRVDLVMKRLYDAGLRLNKQKCIMEASEITYLGHILSSEGMKIDPKKVEAISNLKKPSTVKELQRLLGTTVYLSKFIPNYSMLTEPLRKLLLKDTVWEWSSEQDDAFERIKETIKKAPVLRFFDVSKPVTLSVDASSTAVGAALLQEGQPIAYATQALTPTQARYPQIEKEAYAIRFGCRKFHEYVYGNKSLTIETDHKPLESISKKPLHVIPPRLQRIFYDILQYSPRILYKKGTEIPLADILSRDCESQEIPEEDDLEVQIVLPMSHTASVELQQVTNEDPQSVTLKQTIQNGWPEERSEVPKSIIDFWTIRDELSIYGDIIYKGSRPFVPTSLRRKYMKFIHEGHFGINASLRRAREAIFWPGMTVEIANYIKSCDVCQGMSRSNDKEPIISKPIPGHPFERVATDLFDFSGSTHVIVTDSYSGFFDFTLLNSLSSEAVINQLKKWFSVHGIPAILESDNGPQYSSKAFQEFVKKWQIQHETSSPGHPRANGLAEKSVQTAKKMLKSCSRDNTDPYLALLNYRNTPRSADLESPAKRLFGRNTRTRVPTKSENLQHQAKNSPDVISALQKAREVQKSYADRSTKDPEDLKVGDKIRIQKQNRFWEGGKIIEKHSPRSFIVQNQSGKIIRRNTSHLRKTEADMKPQAVIIPKPSRTSVEPRCESPSPEESIPAVPAAVEKHVYTRSGRLVKAPEKLNL